jgi:hypothetical protein
MLVLTSVALAIVIPASPVRADDAVKRVHCERGQALAKALDNARPGDTFLLSGTCQERVTIAIDRITLDGQGSAVIDGGGGGPAEFSAVVTIQSASGVTLKGLTVRNGPGEGILTRGGASFTLQAAEVHHNGFTGVSVGANSTAEVIDTNIHHNGLGVDVYNASSVVVKGAIAITENSGNGVDINGEAVLEIRGAHVRANDNGIFGIAAGSGQLAIFNLVSSADSTLTANGNGFAGILVAGGAKLTALPRCKITVANNNVFGLVVANGVAGVVNGNAEFVAEGNQIGLRFEQVGTAIFQGGPLTVRNNGVGLMGDGAGTLTILSDPAKPSSITNNGLDVDLKFGTRATFQGVAIGSITCDATVLSRGTTVCP